MPAAVIIDFVARGIPDIARAFRSIESIVSGSERTQLRFTREGVAAREREYQRLAKTIAKLSQESAGVVERTERDKVAAAKRATQEISKTYSAADRENESRRRADVRSADRAEQDKYRSARRWSDAERDVRRRTERFANSVAGAAGRGASNGLRIGARVASGIAGTFAQLGGGFSIADAVSGQANLGRSAALFANSASLGVNGVTAADVAPEKLIARAKAASITTGTDAQELLEGGRSYVAASGDFKGGMENLEFFGKAAKGTGASVSDVSRALGLIRAQNKDLDAAGAQGMALAMIKQGLTGSVEFENLAQAAGKITRTATSFSGNQSLNQQKLLGLSQIAYRTAGSTGGAAVALSALGSDTRGHHAAISQALGYNVLDPHGKITRSPEQLLADLMGATGGDLAKLGQHGGLGFTKPTMKIFEALTPAFEKAQKEALLANPRDKRGANAAGARAALGEMQQVTGPTLSMGELDTMVQRVLQSPAEQFEASIRQLKMAVGEKLLPAFIQLIPALEKLMPAIKSTLDAFVGIANWVASNPWSSLFIGVGASVALAIGAEIAKAGIAAAIRGLLLGGGGGGGGLLAPILGRLAPAALPLGEGAIATGAGGGLLATASALATPLAAAAAAGAVAAGVTALAVHSEFAGASANTTSYVERQMGATNLIGDLKHGGPMSAEKRTEAQDMIARLKSDLAHQWENRQDPSLIKRLSSVTASDEMVRKDATEQNRTIAGIQDTITRLIAALGENTAATTKSTKLPGDPNFSFNAGPPEWPRMVPILNRNPGP